MSFDFFLSRGHKRLLLFKINALGFLLGAPTRKTVASLLQNEPHVCGLYQNNLDCLEQTKSLNKRGKRRTQKKEGLELCARSYDWRDRTVIMNMKYEKC